MQTDFSIHIFNTCDFIWGFVAIKKSPSCNWTQHRSNVTCRDQTSIVWSLPQYAGDAIVFVSKTDSFIILWLVPNWEGRTDQQALEAWFYGSVYNITLEPEQYNPIAWSFCWEYFDVNQFTEVFGLFTFLLIYIDEWTCLVYI